MTTQTDALAPQIKGKESSSSFVFRVLLGTLFLSIAAQIRIPLPFTPVPITLQTCAVMLMGVFLGKEKGFLSIMLYLAAVGIGLPVLSGGEANVLALLGVRGGYLFGFLAQCYLASIARERGTTLMSLAFWMTLSSLSVLLIGSLWLGLYVGFSKCFYLGFFPFLPGEILKTLSVASLIRRLP